MNKTAKIVSKFGYVNFLFNESLNILIFCSFISAGIGYVFVIFIVTTLWFRVIVIHLISANQWNWKKTAPSSFDTISYWHWWWVVCANIRKPAFIVQFIENPIFWVLLPLFFDLFWWNSCQLLVVSCFSLLFVVVGVPSVI